ARVVYYGLGEGAAIRASHIASDGLEGVRFVLHADGESAEVRLPLPGHHNVVNALAAAGVGLAAGMTFAEVAAGLSGLTPGLRLTVLPGANGSTIIDDTYNASPASTIAALEVLAQLPHPRTAILGDMLELGSYEEEGHREVGRRAAQVLDHLIVVGERARSIAAEAASRGLADVAYFAASDEVVYTPGVGEHILVKGSRSMRMENVVAKLRAEEARA
ncbi:MAG: glutamate ligase domain-containing protein, partial [Chloroflexota bacterium]